MAKKKTITPADNLIESLMEDLKDIQSEAESSIHEGSSDLAGDDYAFEPDEDILFSDSAEEGGMWHALEQAEMPETPQEERVQNFKADDAEDRTVNLSGADAGVLNFTNYPTSTSSTADTERTLAVTGFAKPKEKDKNKFEPEVRVSIGGKRNDKGAGNVLTSIDASLAQAENLKYAQLRILDLEKEVESLRSENEELASAGEIIRSRTDDMNSKVSKIEREKLEIQDSLQSEILILKSSLQYKDSELLKIRTKNEDLDTRLKSDFKKIRVRERELENRLEIARAEKSALVRSKDEYILEQKRKIDQLSQELDNYRKKCLELNKTIEANQDQVKRTERALRLALTNLENQEENLVPLKKAD